MIFTEQIVVNRNIQDLVDSGQFTPAQIEMISIVAKRIFAVGYDIGSTDNPVWKPILQCDKYGNVIEEFRSAYDGHKKTGISYKHISAVANGREHSAGGFIWRYKNLKDYGIE